MAVETGQIELLLGEREELLHLLRRVCRQCGIEGRTDDDLVDQAIRAVDEVPHKQMMRVFAVLLANAVASSEADVRTALE
jgi:hypothetical protein